MTAEARKLPAIFTRRPKRMRAGHGNCWEGGGDTTIPATSTAGVRSLLKNVMAASVCPTDEKQSRSPGRTMVRGRTRKAADCPRNTCDDTAVARAEGWCSRKPASFGGSMGGGGLTSTPPAATTGPSGVKKSLLCAPRGPIRGQNHRMRPWIPAVVSRMPGGRQSADTISGPGTPVRFRDSGIGFPIP